MLVRLWSLALVCGCVWGMTGCDWLPGANSGDLDELAGDLETDEEAAAGGIPGSAGESELKLQLKVGDRFPLMKTVQQTLIQASPGGELTSTSSLEILLSITVEEAPEAGERAGQKRLGVQYHQVRFVQDLSGERVDYDSRQPPRQVPLAAQGYHGLVGNGFYFWLGADNQIKEMVGFTEFIERCLQGVAPERQGQVRAVLAATSGADGLANFVDDSIGLLPSRAVRVGEQWMQSRQVREPISMHQSSQYTLESINDSVAEIAILGTIAPAYQAASVPGSGLEVTLKAGRAFGKCTIDVHTGLPLQSTVEQVLDMKVRLPEAAGQASQEFDQRKKMVTTIRAFPESHSAPLADAGGAAQVLPTGPVSVPAGGGPLLVDPAQESGSTVSANYGDAPRR